MLVGAGSVGRGCFVGRSFRDYLARVSSTAAPAVPSLLRGMRAAAVIVLPAFLLFLVLVASVVGALVYWALVGPRLRRWGATSAEVEGHLPGDDVLPTGRTQSTRAVTILAPRADVWPWLVQLGQGRGGFYSYDWLANLAGLEVDSADRIVPEWQRLEPGDLVRAAPEGFADAGWRVLRVEPERALILDLEGGMATWALVLDERSDGTRLISRWRFQDSLALRLMFTLVIEVQHFVMERRMLLGIRKRATARTGGEAR